VSDLATTKIIQGLRWTKPGLRLLPQDRPVLQNVRVFGASFQHVPGCMVQDSQRGTYLMKGDTAERWRKLCEQAAIEQDPQKLLELSEEINRLLEAKEQRLKNEQANRQSAV
jgi:hypothetical protein